MKKTLLLILTSLVLFAGCSKNEENLVPDDETPGVLTFITRDSPVGTIGMLDGVEGIVVELPEVKEGDGDWWHASKDYPSKKVVIATKNVGATSPEDDGSTEQVYEIWPKYYNATVWRLPHIEEFCGLNKIDNVTYTEKGCSWPIGNHFLYLCCGYYISDEYGYDFGASEETLDGFLISSQNLSKLCRLYFRGWTHIRLVHDMPKQ